MNSEPRYCSRCGNELNQRECDGRLRHVCSACGHIAYVNPIPSVAAILFRESRVLLVKRNIEPGLGLWSLPGGFMETGETVEQAVVREVREETGFMCRPRQIIGLETYLGGFYGDVLVIGYSVEQLSGTFKAGGDADEARFFDISDLPPIAFDIHRQFIYKHAGRKIELQEP